MMGKYHDLYMMAADKRSASGFILSGGEDSDIRNKGMAFNLRTHPRR
jgi:hypothetical protein